MSEQIEFSLDEELTAGVRAAAEREQVPPAQWVVQAIATGLGEARPHHEPEPAPEPTEAIMSTPPMPPGPPDPHNPHGWELATSPANSFTVQVPRGWNRDLQQRQTGPTSFVRWASTTSPDGATTIITADPDIPWFVAPGGHSAHPQAVTMDPAPAEQWANTYLNYNLGSRTDFEITNQRASEEMLNWLRRQRDNGEISFTWESGAAVEARWSEGETTRNVTVLAWTGGDDAGGWTARAVRILSSGDANAFVPAALKVAQSVELTPGERVRQGFSGENKAWLGAWGKKAARGINKAFEDIGGSKTPPPPPQQGYGYGQQPPPPPEQYPGQPRT